MSMEIRPELAETIIDMFGPCTAMQETSNVDDVVQRANEYFEDNSDHTLSDFINDEYWMECLHWEILYDRRDEKVPDDIQDILNDLAARLTAQGFKICRAE